MTNHVHAQADIIVCGGGFSGLAASVAALEAGARVTVIEKAPELGGTALLSGGLVWTIADYEHLRSAIPHGDPALQWLVYDGVDAARAWLAQCGAKLGPTESMLGHGRGQAIDPAQAIGVMADRFRALGGVLMLDTALESLVTSDGAVTGVRAIREGRPVELRARAVILATGGFQGNPELLTCYARLDPANLVLRAGPWSTGDGFIAATGIGAAATAGLDTFYGHALTMAPARYTPFQFRDASQYYGQLSVALNMNGERFCDESDGHGEEIINQSLARQPGGRGFYVIDSDILGSIPIQGLEVATRAIIDRARALGAPIVEASTLEALCKRLAEIGVPEPIARHTLQGFNALIEAGRADELRPGRRRNRKPLNAPPFYAVGVQAAITFTMGGLRTDERSRVLRRTASTSVMAPTPTERAYVETDGSLLTLGAYYRQATIHGLFAAGCDVGNISHFGYMGGLATALTTGLSAGREAAAQIGNHRAR